MFNVTAKIFSLITSFLCSITKSTSQFHHDKATSHTPIETVNGLTTNHIDHSPDLNTIQHAWDILDRTSSSAYSGIQQYSSGINQAFNKLYAPVMHCSCQFRRWSYPLLRFSLFCLTPNDASWNTLTIISPVCFHQIMFKQI